MGTSTQRRWPKNAEASRTETIEACREGKRLAREGRDAVRRYPLSAELAFADLTTILERIERLMVEAKVGTD